MYTKKIKSITTFLLVVIMSFFLVAPVAAFEPTGGTVFRIKLPDGKVVYSDTIPRGTNIRNVQVLSIVTGARDNFVLTQPQQHENQAGQMDEQGVNLVGQQVEQAQRDQILLATFRSVQDIESMRNTELSQLRRAIENDESNAAVLNQRLSSIEQEIRQSPNNVGLIAERTRIQQNIAAINGNLIQNRTSLEQRSAHYERDIKRFTELMQKIEQNRIVNR